MLSHAHKSLKADAYKQVAFSHLSGINSSRASNIQLELDNFKYTITDIPLKIHDKLLHAINHLFNLQ